MARKTKVLSVGLFALACSPGCQRSPTVADDESPLVDTSPQNPASEQPIGQMETGQMGAEQAAAAQAAAGHTDAIVVNDVAGLLSLLSGNFARDQATAGANVLPESNETSAVANDEIGQEWVDPCEDDFACDDGLYCNGPEACIDARCQAGEPPCPLEFCDETRGQCGACSSESACDDGIFCNGTEWCVSGFCQPGAPSCPRYCDEERSLCFECFAHEECDDGDNCNGPERCEEGICRQGEAPGDGSCVGSDPIRFSCDSDTECDDGLFCTGIELCVDGVCIRGGDPCPDGGCLEHTDVCLHEAEMVDCDDGLFCNGQEVLATGGCVAGIDPCPGYLCDEILDMCIGVPCDGEEPPFMGGEAVGFLPSADLDEASGLVASRQSPGVLWTHNDDYGDNRLFALNMDGTILGIYTVGTGARDSEDIAIGPGPEAGVDYLYLGDIGDNESVRGTIFVKRVPEPYVELDQPLEIAALTGVQIINLKYPTGLDAPTHRDAETLLVDPLNGDIYIVTKRTLLGMVYRAAYPHSTTQTTTLDLVAVIPWSGATGGSVSPDGSSVIIRRYTWMRPQASVWFRQPGASLWEAFTLGVPCDVALEDEPLGEAICWDSLGESYLTVSENEEPGAQIPIWQFQRTVP